MNYFLIEKAEVSFVNVIVLKMLGDQSVLVMHPASGFAGDVFRID